MRSQKGIHANDPIPARRESRQRETVHWSPYRGRQETFFPQPFRHGLTGQIVIQTPEDQAVFQKHCDAIRNALAPVGALELDLAQAIAEDKWRLNRARALENAVFTLGLQEHADPDAANTELDAALAQGHTWIAQAKNLQLLTTYEQRIRRSVEKNMAELRALQAERKAAVARAEKEARLLVQLAEAQGNNYDPAIDFPPESQPPGFVFSRHEIKRQIARDQRLEHASDLFKTPARRLSVPAPAVRTPSTLAATAASSRV